MTQKNKQNKAKLIILCGGEGSGKSTIIALLKEALPGAVVTREPGGTLYAEAIRDNMFKNPLAKDANAETMFGQFWAARADHLDHLVIPKLEQGVSVISDRFDCCTYAYQIHAQGGMHLEELFWQTRKVYLRKQAPHLYIFLDVSPEVGLKRVEGRPGKKNHFDERDIAFHQAVKKGYDAFFEKIAKITDGQKSNVAVVNANRSLEEVKADVLSVVQKLGL